MATGVHKFIQDVTDPFTGAKQKRAELGLLGQSLDALKDELRFSQAFGGVQLNKPFKDIEKTRALLNKRASSTSGDILSFLISSGWGLYAGRK